MLRSWTFWRLFLTFGVLWLLPIVGPGAFLVARVDRHERQQIEESVHRRALLARDALRGEADDKEFKEHVARLAEDAGARITVIADDGRVRADSEEDPAVMENHAHRPE